MKKRFNAKKPKLSDKKLKGLSTPRILLEAGSAEECYQSVESLRILWGFKTANEKDWLQTIKELIESETWLKIPEESPYGSFQALVEAELEISWDKFKGAVKYLAKNCNIEALLGEFKNEKKTNHSLENNQGLNGYSPSNNGIKHSDKKLSKSKGSRQKTIKIHAPPIVRKLYENNCLSESQAAWCGIQELTPERRGQIAQIEAELEQLPIPISEEERTQVKRQANAIVNKFKDKKIVQIPINNRKEAAQEIINSFSRQEVSELAKHLENYLIHGSID